MGERLGVQVVKVDRYFSLVVKTRTTSMDVFANTPPEFSLKIWTAMKDRALAEVKNWLQDADRGHGIIVFEGEYFEYITSDHDSQYVNWPAEVKKAFAWLKRRFDTE
jgi:hypothetical protein